MDDPFRGVIKAILIATAITGLVIGIGGTLLVHWLWLHFYIWITR